MQFLSFTIGMLLFVVSCFLSSDPHVNKSFEVSINVLIHKKYVLVKLWNNILIYNKQHRWTHRLRENRANSSTSVLYLNVEFGILTNQPRSEVHFYDSHAKTSFWTWEMCIAWNTSLHILLRIGISSRFTRLLWKVNPPTLLTRSMMADVSLYSLLNIGLPNLTLYYAVLVLELCSSWNTNVHCRTLINKELVTRFPEYNLTVVEWWGIIIRYFYSFFETAHIHVILQTNRLSAAMWGTVLFSKL